MTAVAASEKENATSWSLNKEPTCRKQEARQVFARGTLSHAGHELVGRKGQCSEETVLDWLESCFAPLELSTKLDTRRLGFYDLPAEIRNKIAGYILRPHDICPTPRAFEDWTSFVRTHRSSRAPGLLAFIEKGLIKCLRRNVSTEHLIGVRASQWDCSLKPLFGFQFLATCSRAYHDYHAFLYLRNSFFLAPGSPDITSPYFSNLQFKHWLLIPRLVVYFSVLDITPHAMVTIEYGTRHVWNQLRGFADSPTTRTKSRFLILIQRYLAKCWVAKLKWLREKVQGKEVMLFARDQNLLVIKDPIDRHLGADITHDMNGVCPSIQTFIAVAWHNIMGRIDIAVQRAFRAYADGVIPHHKKAIDAFREWLAQQEKEEYLNQRLEAFAGNPPFSQNKNNKICCEGFELRPA